MTRLKYLPLLCACLALSLLAAVSACGFQQAPPAVPTAILPASAPTRLAAIPTPAATPTSLPLPPTPVPVALPQPTYDPNLADWTVMVYLSADNSLEEAALLDVNEMEAAGSSDRVNVLVQLDRAVGETAAGDDWTDTRRYLIGSDEDASVITSEPLALPGELNMGDPGVLADFLLWGISSYPANRYALVVKGPGAGWQGVAFDRDTPTFDGGDDLSLADLDGALAQALDGRQLDVIAFDASMMAQLDVLRTLQPHARYAVAAPGLVPASGWNYGTLLGRLYDNPQMDGAQLSRQMVADFVEHYTQVEPADFVTMAAVDLAHLPALAYTVEVLALNLAANPAFVAGAIAVARSDADAYVAAPVAGFASLAAVDLHHYASAVAQISPDERLAAAAHDVVQAVSDTVIAAGYGERFENSQGVALYFPRQADHYLAEYGQTAGAAAWHTFLQSYYQVLAGRPAPQVTLASVLDRPAGVQNPALLDLEVVGREIGSVAFIGARREADGRQRLMLSESVASNLAMEPTAGRPARWRDGVHQDSYLWRTEASYLYDAAGNGDFVVAWPAGPDDAQFLVSGRYRRGANDIYLDAYLIFDQVTGEPTRLWAVEGGALTELRPQPGDEFQPDALYRQAAGETAREPGPGLIISEEQILVMDRRPLPDGDYFFGLAAETIAGVTAEAFVELAVANSAAIPGFRAYFDPYLGFQFLYPDTWSAPVYSDGLLIAGDRQRSTRMQITIYPQLEPGVELARLKAEALAQFGSVAVLFEDEVVVGGVRGLRTAYGYTDGSGQSRTGVFFTFVQERSGFVVDVDGPAEAEAATVTTVATMAQSWATTSIDPGRRPGRWTRVDFGAFAVAQPDGFAHQPFNEWQRFSSGPHTFAAFRVNPAAVAATETLALLLRDAGANVNGFNAGDAYRFPLAGALWQRADFSYRTAEGDDIWGFIVVKEESGQEVAAWVEAPAATYNELERDVFLIMIADLALAE